MRKTRLFYAGLFCLLLIAEILIALFVNDNFIRPYVGDALVTLLICSFLRIVFPKGISLLPAYVFVFAVAVEVGQYFDVIGLLGIESRFLSVLLGRTFSYVDVLCYAVGCLLSYAIDRVTHCPKQTVPERPSWEEIVDSMQGKELHYLGCSIVRMIPSKDRSRRIIILKSENGYFKIKYEELCPYDEEEWVYLCNVAEGRYANWNPVGSTLNSVSFYGTEADAMQVVLNAPEYKKYFI